MNVIHWILLSGIVGIGLGIVLLALSRKTRTGPAPEPGTYVCGSKKCGWAFVYVRPNHWVGPFIGDASGLSTGREMTWEQMQDNYADCVANLKRSEK